MRIYHTNLLLIVPAYGAICAHCWLCPQQHFQRPCHQLLAGPFFICSALVRYENVQAIVADMQAQGVVSVRNIATRLNERGIVTPRGGLWHPTSVARLVEQLAAG